MEQTNFQKVGEFMKAYDQDVHTTARFPEPSIRMLRFNLIDEELGELDEAMVKQDDLDILSITGKLSSESEFINDSRENLIEIADALTDLLYVVYGAGHAYGIDLDACFNEVQRSNMSKLGENGKAIKREDGKIMKGPNYSPPNLRGILKF
jgi:predicted HAD superfamily Cof-like phosphohydrolase